MPDPLALSTRIRPLGGHRLDVSLADMLVTSGWERLEALTHLDERDDIMPMLVGAVAMRTFDADRAQREAQTVLSRIKRLRQQLLNCNPELRFRNPMRDEDVIKEAIRLIRHKFTQPDAGARR